MSVETVNLFLAILTFGGAVLVLVVVVLGVLSLFVRDGHAARLLDDLQAVALPLAFLAATTATLGSLYYSEIAGFDPCRLCWVQRSLMYPSAVLLGVSLVRPRLRPLPLGLSIAGICVSIYHRLEQEFPDQVGGACEIDNPCSGRWVDTFGFITIPTMAGVAFAMVIVFVALSYRPLGPAD